MEWLPLITGGVGALTGAIGAYLAIRRDGRETRSQALAESAETIRLLKDQTELLRTQLEKRGDEWTVRENKLETRIHELENSYRDLVLFVTQAQLCAEAPFCTLYNPGDRRKNP